MDAATISAIAAHLVAVFALMVAFAQAIQQYFITGQGIRLCDSVVFADMPGQGRRIWQASQFRFRVVYSIPQISLPNRFWPPNWSVSYKEGRHSLPNLSGFGEYTVVRVVQPDFPYIQRLREREIVYEEDILSLDHGQERLPGCLSAGRFTTLVINASTMTSSKGM
jgi:hypothetical protein